MLLTQDLHSPSGLGRYFPLAKYLVREGAQVTILALNSDFANLDQLDFVTEGVDVRYVAQMHVRKSGNMTYYFSPTQLAIISFKAIIVLFREGMKENADLIFVGKPHPMNGLAGLRLARRKGLPLIIDCDDYEALYELMTHDKKNEGGIINFTLLSDIGEVQINQSVDKQLVLSALDFYRESFGI